MGLDSLLAGFFCLSGPPRGENATLTGEDRKEARGWQVDLNLIIKDDDCCVLLAVCQMEHELHVDV